MVGWVLLYRGGPRVKNYSGDPVGSSLLPPPSFPFFFADGLVEVVEQGRVIRDLYSNSFLPFSLFLSYSCIIPCCERQLPRALNSEVFFYPIPLQTSLRSLPRSHRPLPALLPTSGEAEDLSPFKCSSTFHAGDFFFSRSSSRPLSLSSVPSPWLEGCSSLRGKVDVCPFSPISFWRLAARLPCPSLPFHSRLRFQRTP